MRGAAFLLIMLWAPGYGSNSGVYEQTGTLGGIVTVTAGYDPRLHMNYISSWCRQMTEKLCDDVVDSRGATSWRYQGRASMVSNNRMRASATVRIRDLREWDTGLYCWRIWNGNAHEVLNRILLVVVIGLDPGKGPRVLRQVVGESVTLECVYNQSQRWSKEWCKQTSDKSCDWIGHSDGSINPDHQWVRSSVSMTPQAGRMELTIRDLQLWDSGFYLCKESGGFTVLCSTILVVSHKDSADGAGTTVKMLPKIDASTAPSTTLPGPTTHPWGKSKIHFKIIGTEKAMKTTTVPASHGQSLSHDGHFNHSIPGPTPSSDTETHYLAWDILRWILCLILITCTAMVSCVDKTSTIFTEVTRHNRRIQ
ncbi:polymeric immunoglobulin receptor-like [Lissotriton helveticus]